eukprot:CAMPEP_0201518564 /NCGR_PEP_ID=MMETSP0161_2-20130828/9369_1 /ASSEMBLY_ACC=CAM_ASM_000251 /TAXON_ID=180227 /ORGANISM="Neoparamoeba aestuarina, Strain SoJaBio B1-5/56/2" /LENGTH=63 /DNA_ID=CAMNT_0047916373 /DNA_START=1282 /DNA_END=1473 /DNA_ORIENTATION=+
MANFLIESCGCDPFHPLEEGEFQSSLFEVGDTPEMVAQRYENDKVLELLKKCAVDQNENDLSI